MVSSPPFTCSWSASARCARAVNRLRESNRANTNLNFMMFGFFEWYVSELTLRPKIMVYELNIKNFKGIRALAVNGCPNANVSHTPLQRLLKANNLSLKECFFSKFESPEPIITPG